MILITISTLTGKVDDSTRYAAESNLMTKTDICALVMSHLDYTINDDGVEADDMNAMRDKLMSLTMDYDMAILMEIINGSYGDMELEDLPEDDKWSMVSDYMEKYLKETRNIWEELVEYYNTTFPGNTESDLDINN